jgi:hypothetical protein
MRISVILCAPYWIFLTILLLVPNPAAAVGMKEAPIFPWGKFGIHLSFFTILGVLANSARWPKRLSWSLIAFMAIYAIATETLQLFVPHRTAQVIDGIEDLFGIALGSVIYWLVWRLCRKEENIILGEEEEMLLDRLSRIGQKKG